MLPNDVFISEWDMEIKLHNRAENKQCDILNIPQQRVIFRYSVTQVTIANIHRYT